MGSQAKDGCAASFVRLAAFKMYLNAFLGSLDAQRRAHDTLHMSSDAAHTAMTAANEPRYRHYSRRSKKPSPAFPTTSSSRTFSDLSISTIPPIWHGSQR